MRVVGKFLLLAATLFTAAQISVAQTWTRTSAPTNDWVSVAASADGTVLAAAGGQFIVNYFNYSFITAGPIYISTNSGTTWRLTPAPVTNWVSVASSGDGSILVAAYQNSSQNGGAVYYSTNYGAAWNQAALPNWPWNFAAVSASGNLRVAGSSQRAGVYYSTNSDVNWLQVLTPPGPPTLLAISADGSRVVAPFIGGGGGSGNIMTVTNPATGSRFWDWTQIAQAPLAPWSAIALSSDGGKIIASYCAGYPAQGIAGVYFSTNSGLNWTLANFPSNFAWDAVASSADGSRMLAAFAKPFEAVFSPIYVSTNGGASWATNTLPGAFHYGSQQFFSSVALSADGGLMVAAIYGGGIWTARSTLPPQLNAGSSAGNNLTLSWIVPSTNFVLQQSSDLANWSDATCLPALNLTNLHDEVILPLTNNGGFFRLTTP